jgi:serine protease Do
MKTKSSLWTAAGFAAVMISPAFALEAPADDAPPPPAVKKQANPLPQFKLDPAPARPLPAVEAAEKSAFLGVVSAQVPACLAEHINLKPGEGVIVRSLVPEGPAAKAGLAVNDVITRIGDQPVGSPEDVSKLVTTHQPGDTLTLEFIHQGKPAKTDVALGTRPADLAIADPGLDLMHLNNLPKELADRIRDNLAGKIGGIDLNLGADAAAIPPQLEEAMRQLQKRMEGAIGQGGFNFQDDAGAVAGKVQASSSATFKMKDDEGSVEVKSIDGSKEVTIRDPQDKVTWSGPWDTEQDKAAAPPEVRTRMEGLNLDSKFQGPGLRFKMNQAQPPAADER